MKFKKIAAVIAAMLVLVQLVPAECRAAESEVKLPVLMYHHICVNPKMWGKYVVSPKTFEEDLKYLKTHGYETVSLKELIAYTQGDEELPEKPVMLTFDDGQRSFAEYAVPLLEKYDMCAVEAIVGKYADIYTQNGDTNVAYAYMSWPELKSLSENPHVELQAHTYDMHGLFPRCGCCINKGENKSEYRTALNSDLNLLNSRFEEKLGYVPSAFAYPYGRKCSECRPILLQKGYKVIFSCDEKINSITRSPECLYDLGRFNRPDGAGRSAFFTRLGIV